MKLNFKHFLTMTLCAYLTAANSNPAQWSRFIKTQNQDDVIISFRQMRKNQSWFIEWHVKNDSNEKVEPILLSRQYICKNGESQTLKQQSLGVYKPGSQGKGGIKDKGICPNSKIKLVEIESEILRLPIDIDQQTPVSAL
ncbi:MAG: hypothetical protein AB8B80_11850 [Marinicellaceae bacterium]